MRGRGVVDRPGVPPTSDAPCEGRRPGRSAPRAASDGWSERRHAESLDRRACLKNNRGRRHEARRRVMGRAASPASNARGGRSARPVAVSDQPPGITLATARRRLKLLNDEAVAIGASHAAPYAHQRFAPMQVGLSLCRKNRLAVEVKQRLRLHCGANQMRGTIVPGAGRKT